MPNLQNLVLTDRATPTPVNHTFTPYGIDANGVGIVQETGATLIGAPRFTVARRVAGKRYHATLRMTVPVVQTETINGIDYPKVVRRAHVDATFTFDEASSEQERKDAVGMFQSALDPSKVLTNDVLIKLQTVYGA